MSEIEKQFFETFNLIKYKLISKYDKRITYGPFDSLEDINVRVKGAMKHFIIEEVCPQITDRVLLELSALCSGKSYDLYKKDQLIKFIVLLGDNTYKISEVQALFKEDN